jgi:hypothetical protein
MSNPLFDVVMGVAVAATTAALASFHDIIEVDELKTNSNKEKHHVQETQQKTQRQNALSGRDPFRQRDTALWLRACDLFSIDCCVFGW